MLTQILHIRSLPDQFRHLFLHTQLLLRLEVVDDVKELPDFLRSLSSNHIGDGLAADVATPPLAGKAVLRVM